MCGAPRLQLRAALAQFKCCSICRCLTMRARPQGSVWGEIERKKETRLAALLARLSAPLHRNQAALLAT